MVQDQGVHVYLAPFGNIKGRYRGYAVPVDSPVFTGDPNDVWIEAVEGERFIIVVDSLKDFDPKASKALRIRSKINSAWNLGHQSYSQLKDGVPYGIGI
jgi:hypothetical protein